MEDDSDDDNNNDTNGGEEQIRSEDMDMENEGKDEESEKEDINFASGQEGLLILDSLDEDFLAEVSGLGLSTLPFFSTIFLTFLKWREVLMKLICPSFVLTPLKLRIVSQTKHSISFALPSLQVRSIP